MVSDNFDLLCVSYIWIILDAALACACIIFLSNFLIKYFRKTINFSKIFLVGLCANIPCCIGAIFSVPFIAISGLVIAVDIILMIIWSQAYKKHVCNFELKIHITYIIL